MEAEGGWLEERARERWPRLASPSLRPPPPPPPLHSHQLPAHDLAHVHEVKHKPVLLPVDAVHLPVELGLALARAVFVDGVPHLGFKVVDDGFDLVKAGGELFAAQAAAE